MTAQLGVINIPPSGGYRALGTQSQSVKTPSETQVKPSQVTKKQVSGSSFDVYV